MSTDLISVKGTDREDAAIAVANTTAYFSRMKLCQANAKEVNKGLVERGGHWAIIRGKDEVQDLGKKVDVVICTSRAKALRTGDVIMSVFDPESDEFKKIMEESKDKDSGSMYGPEYLVYVPATNEFATLYLSSPTARREASKFHTLLRKAATIGSKYIETEKFSWFGPSCEAAAANPVDLPAQEEFEAAIERFMNEKPSKVATVDESTSNDRDR